jgi:tetratricopeptide (TPR) repeat protein
MLLDVAPLSSVSRASTGRAETGCAPVTELRDYKTLVRAAWRARDFNAVAAVADKLLDKAPKTIDVARMRVKALLLLGRAQEAGNAVLPIAVAEPRLALTVAGALVKAHELDAAARIVIALRKAGADAPDNFHALAGKVASLLLAAGDAAEKSGAADKALTAFLLGAAADPANVALQRKVAALRAAARNMAKDVDFEKDAAAYVAAWKNLLALDATNVNAMKRLAVAAEKAGDHAAALEMWGRVMDCDPSIVAAPARVARAALRCGKEYDALLLLERLKRLGDAGDYADHLRRKVAAAGKALLRDSDGFGASYSIALIMRTGAGDEETNLLARKTLALLKGDAKRALRGRDTAGAATIASRMLEFEPANALALSAVARYAYLMQDFAAAASYYDRLTAAEPDNARHWLALSRARSRAGDAEGAQAAQQRANALASSTQSAAPSAGKSDAASKISSWMRKR